MKYIKKINEFYGGEGGTTAPRDKDDVYAILTEKSKNKKGPVSFAQDGYHFLFSSKDELKKLKLKYPIGGKYKGEIITGTDTLNSKHLY
jgi:hypothetical protein